MTGRSLPAAPQQLLLAQAALQALAPAHQGLVDSLGGRGQAPLQDGEGEAYVALAPLAGQPVGAVELLAHVAGDRLVELGLRVGKLVLHRVGLALREQGRVVEAHELLLDVAAHQVGNVHHVHPVAELALEAVLVQ
jgi:hypothetical protein